jgi:DNA primase
LDNGTLPERVVEWQQNLWTATDVWPNGPAQYLVDRGLTPEYIEKYLFGYVPSGYYADSISIPVLDGLAQYKTTRFRRLDPGSRPKYEGYKGERAHLFNISSVRHKVVHVTEGEFDATLLEQLGRHSVGVPGINNFEEDWKWLFLDNDVRVVFDSEVPQSEAHKGVQKALAHLKQWVEPIADRISFIQLPTGHDVTSLYLEDPTALEEILAAYDA